MLILAVLWAGSATQAQAQEPPAAPHSTDASSTDPQAIASEISQAIQTLETADQGQRYKLLFDLAQLEDPVEQQRLQRLFDERLEELAQTGALRHEESLPSFQAPEDTHLASDATAATETLSLQIELLTLGPQATIEHLRARDAVVSAIAGVPDPIQREQLLRRLEEREAEADNTRSSPSASAVDSLQSQTLP